MSETRTVAVTGGTGFVGQNLIETLIENGFSVRALTRRDQAERAGITWIRGALEDKGSLLALCDGADAVVNLAGLTKALDRETYFTINANAARSLFEAAADAGVRRVIHMSSMAAREPQLSDYGASKAAADLILEKGHWPFSWTSLRPPAIYGPHEKEILKLIRTAGGRKGGGILPAPAGKESRAGFIHVADLSAAVLALIKGGEEGRIVEIDDGTLGGYRMQEIGAAIIGDEGKMPTVIPVPRAIGWMVGLGSDLVSRAIRSPLITSSGHMRYLAHTDWSVNEAKRAQIPGWQPRFNLSSGMKDMLDWAEGAGLL